MAAGLFELRKDPITGWWVATVVDRAFHRDRSPAPRNPSTTALFGCATARRRTGAGVRVRMLKDFAFHVVGTDDDARELDRGIAQVALAQARATGSWRTVVAPPGEHRALHAVGNEHHRGLSRCAREALAEAAAAGQTDYLQVVQNWGAQAGARTNHLCLDLYDLPQIPHRVAEEMGGAARFVIREGECPFCRLVRDESRRPDRLVWEDASSVAFAPYASRSSFEVWIVPRGPRGGLRPGHAPDVAATAEALRQVLSRLATSLDGPPYNLVLHTAPLREQVDATYHWHWEIHPRLREIAGLELGTGLPVNSGLARGRRRGAARSRRGDRRWRRLMGPSRTRASHGGESVVIGPTSARRPSTALGAHPRSETCGRRSPLRRPSGRRLAPSASDREARHERRLGSRRGRVFVETLFGRHHGEIYAYLAPDGPRAGACRGPDPGRVRQGLPQLRHARAARERPGLALPDRPPRGPRRDPPPQDHPVPAVDRRVPGSAPSAEHMVMDMRLSGDMQRALARIPERQRAALLLAELHDLTGLELAAALGVSHVAARALLTRARESLRQALAAERAAEADAEAVRDPRKLDEPRAARSGGSAGSGADADHWASPHERARERGPRSD